MALYCEQYCNNYYKISLKMYIHLFYFFLPKQIYFALHFTSFKYSTFLTDIRQVIFLLLENKTEETVNVCTVTLRVSFIHHPTTVSRIKNSRSTSSHHVCLRHFVSLQICRFRHRQAEEASHNDDVTLFHSSCREQYNTTTLWQGYLRVFQTDYYH